MLKYYINENQQSNGDYEVHVDDNTCPHPADDTNKIDLGFHSDCQSAVTKAKTMFPQHSHQINGCYWCCRPCHTT